MATTRIGWSFNKGPIVKPRLLCKFGMHKWLNVTHGARKSNTGPPRYFNLSSNCYRGCKHCGCIEATCTGLMWGKKWIKWGFTNPDFLKDGLTLANIVDLTSFDLNDIMQPEVFEVLMIYVTQILNKLHNENWQLGDKVVTYWDHYYCFGPYYIGLPHVAVLDGQDHPPDGYIIIKSRASREKLNITLNDVLNSAHVENKIKSFIASSGPQ
jgi:hypothetical protein